MMRGLEQRELAKLAGISKSALSRFERGERRVYLDLLGALAEALGVRPARLLEPPPKEPKPEA